MVSFVPRSGSCIKLQTMPVLRIAVICKWEQKFKTIEIGIFAYMRILDCRLQTLYVQTAKNW